MTDTLYTATEVAHSLGISRQMVVRKAKRIGCKKLGNQYMITEEEKEIISNKQAGRPWC